MKKPFILFSRIDHRTQRHAGCECQCCTPTMRPPVARFWVAYGGGLYAMVKLPVGGRLTHVDGGQTDEGYDVTYRTWQFDGERVTVRYDNYAQDCDGPISRGGDSWCYFWELSSGYRPPECEVTFPRWREGGREWQRDAFAEAAGY